MDDDSQCAAATPSGDLYRDLMDCNIAKSEMEHFAARKISELESQVRWVPVSERFPEKVGYYPVQLDGQTWDRAYWSHFGRWDGVLGNPIAWREIGPLPEPLIQEQSSDE